jgi:hypothetical protein
MALAIFMQLSSLKAAHVVVGECRVTGNPGAPVGMTKFNAATSKKATRMGWQTSHGSFKPSGHTASRGRRDDKL